MTQSFTPYDLRQVRAVHVARLRSRRQYDSRTGECVGAPYPIVVLGRFLASRDAIGEIVQAEREFGLSLDHYMPTGDPEMIAEWLAEGEWFAVAILEDIRAGGNGMRVRMPSKAPDDGHARYNATLMGPAFVRVAA